MGRVFGLALITSTIAVLSVPALAQDVGWAAGTWKGKLENFRGQDPDRVMTIEIVGGAAKCTWAEGFRSKPGSAKSCVVTATDVKLTTGPNNTVELRRSGNALKGSLTSASSGKSYNMTMTKD